MAIEAGILMTDAVTRFCAGTPRLMYAPSTEPAIVEKPTAYKDFYTRWVTKRKDKPDVIVR